MGYAKAPAARPLPRWLAETGIAEQWTMPDASYFEKQTALFHKLSWINDAITLLSQTCASQPFSVKRKTGEDEKDIPNHPFELLLHHPNPDQSRLELLESTFAYLNLTGNAFWWLSRSGPDQEPAEIWALPSNRVVPVPDGRLGLKGYTYDPGTGVLLPLDTWEIVHFKLFNPDSFYLGASRLEALAVSAQAEINRIQYEARIYDPANNGRAPSVMAFSDPYEDSEWETMKRQIVEAGNKRQILPLRGVKPGGVQWIQAAMSNNDMQFLDSRTFSREEIFGTFAPGLASMLAVNATEANAKSGKATFSEYAVFPALCRVAEKITSTVLPAYGDNIVGEFDDPRAKDRQLEINEIVEYSKTHTVAEIRKKYYGDDPLGDERDDLLPAQITAASGQPEPEPEEMPLQQPPQAQPPEQVEQPKEGREHVDEATSDNTETKADLEKWERKSLNSLRAGKAAGVPFDSDHIPPALIGAISGALEASTTPAHVKRVFADARRWEAYP
jgi:HK97 family phage portal protein